MVKNMNCKKNGVIWVRRSMQKVSHMSQRAIARLMLMLLKLKAIFCIPVCGYTCKLMLHTEKAMPLNELLKKLLKHCICYAGCEQA